MEESHFKDLKEKGYTVIKNLFDAEECDKYISKTWDWLESLNTGIKRDDSKTWGNDKWPRQIKGIIEYPTISHEQFIWDIRCDPRIKEIFSTLWKTDELVVSFDRMCIMRPPELTNYHKQQKIWTHIDQSLQRNRLECYQGFLTLENIEDKPGQQDGALHVIEGSHRFHKSLARNLKKHNKPIPSDDWYVLTEEERNKMIKAAGELKRIAAPKGSFVIWDSRLCHSNINPVPNRTIPRWRYVVYVCMTPRSLLSEAQRRKKIKAFEEHRTTSHWPHKIKLFPIKPRSYGNDFPDYEFELNEPILTWEDLRIAGF